MSAIDGESRPRTPAEAWSGRSEPSRWEQLRATSFGPASEEPFRRRITDWIRLGVGTIATALLIAHHGHESALETDFLLLINDLPGWFEPIFRIVNALGALWAGGLVFVAALFARRWRLARDLFIGATATWIIARVTGEIVGGETFAKSLHVITRVGSTPSFPAVRVAVVVAVISVASPYLHRPVRRFGHLLVGLMLFAPLFLGSAEPAGVALGVVLGWTTAAVVHLVFGSPGGRPTTRQVKAALAELGVDAHDVVLAPVQPRLGTVMLTSDDQGALSVRVLGRDETDAQLIDRSVRWLLYKDGTPSFHLTRLEDVEAEAYALLLAERAGVRVPEVVVVGKAGPGAALLVTRREAAAVTLAEADPSLVTDDVLGAVWRDVARLRAAHVTHGRLNASHVLLRAGGVAITDFDNASGTRTTASRLARDVAEMLASTALIVGNERAVGAAVAELGPGPVVEALPLLQSAALSREVRAATRQRGPFAQELTELREEGARATGTEVPQLAPLYRVSPKNVLMAVGTIVAIAVLLVQVGDPEELWQTVQGGDPAWLAIALAVSLLSNVPTAIALMGTVPVDLPLARTTEVQVAMSFSNFAVPSVGGLAAQVRFLQKQGVDLASAIAAGGLLSTVGNVVAQLALVALALVISPLHLSTKAFDFRQLATAVAAFALLVALVGVIVLGIPKVRRAVMTPARDALTTIRDALRSPRNVGLLLGGSTAYALMSAATMAACIAAFNGSISFWTVLSLNILVGSLASLVPIPGGGTAVSSLGMSGALAAAGLPTTTAVAAVIAYQLVFNVIPAVPGWFATNDLLDHDYL